MRTIPRLAVVLALALAGCGGTQTTPTPEARSALTPMGKLRVGFISGSPIHATKDVASGEFKGVAVDLGKEMAQRLGVPFEPVAYASVPALIAGANSGEWDVATMGINAERASVVDFTAPYMEVEFSYLVPQGSRISTLAEVDRPGVRIGVVEKSSPDAYLAGTIRSATLVRSSTIADMVESLQARRVDIIFGTRAGMYSQAEKLAGSHLLEGRSGGEKAGMATPKGRDQSAAYARQFVESAKAQGLVKAAIERAALRGVVVSPRE